MVDNPDDEIVEDEEKEKRSLIPDPIGKAKLMFLFFSLLLLIYFTFR